ncbi:MAG: hypothetical protein E6R13_07475 [Spirochaetes bacterium]|nr:MAG: hypothetical protein E6R13_07475 [Spirochaetota bacterium]
MQIDLHGVKHEDVVRRVDIFIWECMQNNVNQGSIITGNSTVMKEIVTKCLREHGLNPHGFFNNGGKIIFDLY